MTLTLHEWEWSCQFSATPQGEHQTLKLNYCNVMTVMTAPKHFYTHKLTL